MFDNTLFNRKIDNEIMTDKPRNFSRQQPIKSPAEPRITVCTDFELWNFLFQGYANQGPHRYTKAEAFFDLVNRERLAVLTKDSEFLNSSIQTLANVWSWDRSSVRKFIDTLCAIGAASVTTDGYKNTVRLTNVSGLTPQKGADPKQSHPENAPLDESHLQGDLSEG